MYENYDAGNDGAAFFNFIQSLFYYQCTMKHCTDTYGIIKDIADDLFEFFDEDNWWETYQARYEENKDLVDDQMANYLKTWDEGVYFNAGMFYGRVWNVLVFYGTIV